MSDAHPPAGTPRPIGHLLRPEIWDLEEYTPIEPFERLSARYGFPVEQIVKLDANENPYGPSPRVRAALAEWERYHIYPDPASTELCEALSAWCGVPTDYLLCGAGADELIDLVMRVVLRPGDRVINCVPTFGMYSFLAGINGAETVNVRRRDDGSVDVEAVLRAVDDRTKLIVVCAPNNPTGTPLPREAALRLLETGRLVMLDEAYVEFAGLGGSLIGQVPRQGNLIVLRTFSKWAALAGLRLGWGAFPLDLVRQMWKVKQPYNVNVAAQVAGLAALADRDWLLANVERIVAERARLLDRLRTVPYLRPWPSAANFILCDVEGLDARTLRDDLRRRGIFLRYYETPLLRSCIRISVGRPEDTDRLMAVLAEVARSLPAELGVGEAGA